MGRWDGTWELQRVSGLLPPLAGVRKRMRDSHGETLVGPVKAPFEVRGDELHYRPPFTGFVDVLEPVDDVHANGRATFHGREFGRFELRRVEMEERNALDARLVRHIDEALAMEKSVRRMLDGVIATTDDPELREQLQRHRAETDTHVTRMAERLRAHGASPSMVREAGGLVGVLAKSVADLARSDRATRNARDGYATEAMEIASYELLERVAERAGDAETAEAARLNRADEERMASEVAESWDRVVESSLREDGIPV